MNIKKLANGWGLLLALVVALLLAAVLPLFLRVQGGFSLTWGNMSSGYGISQGDGFAVAGTSGEIDGAGALSGDGFTMTGGFWSGVEEPPPLGPTPAPAGYRLFLPAAIGD